MADLSAIPLELLQQYHRAALRGQPVPIDADSRDLAVEIRKRTQGPEFEMPPVTGLPNVESFFGGKPFYPPRGPRATERELQSLPDQYGTPTGKEVTESVKGYRPSVTFSPFGESRPLPPRLTPEVLESRQALEAGEAGPPQVGETRKPVPTAPSAVDAGMRQIFTPPTLRGPAPMPASTPLDVEGTRKRLMEGMPEDRKPGETYKADPYMTMLQTGLRILASRPQLGQSALSQIAGPLAEGAEAYGKEKEKERLSKAEEAKTAREEAYRKYGATRDVESRLLDLSDKQRSYDLEKAKLANLQAQGANENAIKLAQLDLQKAEYRLKETAESNKLSPRQALAIFNDLEEKRLKLEAIPNPTPQQEAERASIERQQAAVQRAYGAYMGAESRAGIADETRALNLYRDLGQQITKITNEARGMPLSEEARKRLSELRQQQAELAARLGLTPSGPQDPNISGVQSRQR